MKLVAYLVVLCGCDQLFGIQGTHHQGIPFYDGMPDTPFACPALGAGAPSFTGVLVQEILQNCQQLSPSFASGRAVALCADSNFGQALCEGPVDSELVCFMSNPSDPYPPEPKLSSDGNTMYLRGAQTKLITPIRAYARTGATWTPTTSPFASMSQLIAMSNFVRGPGGEHVIFDHYMTGNVQILDEWGNDGGTWHLTSSHPLSELGLTLTIAISMTSDGLRALVLGGTGDGTVHMYYSDRPMLDAPFRTATKVEGLFAQSEDASLNDDCSRIYFTGLGSIFYVQQ